jgi:hypothetical protein
LYIDWLAVKPKLKTFKIMELTIGSFYIELGIEFDFSYRINHFIRSQIKEVIMKPLDLLENEPEKFLSLIVSNKSSQAKLEVKLAKKNKRGKFRNYGIWFPYQEIVKAQNPLEKYIENFAKAVLEIFKEWKITEEQTIEFKETLKK